MRNTRITIRVSSEEEEFLNSLASRNNISVNDYIRRRLFEENKENSDYMGEATEYDKRMMALSMRSFLFTTLLCEKLLKKDDITKRKEFVENILVERGVLPYSVGEGDSVCE